MWINNNISRPLRKGNYKTLASLLTSKEVFLGNKAFLK